MAILKKGYKAMREADLVPEMEAWMKIGTGRLAGDSGWEVLDMFVTGDQNADADDQYQHDELLHAPPSLSLLL